MCAKCGHELAPRARTGRFGREATTDEPIARVVQPMAQSIGAVAAEAPECHPELASPFPPDVHVGEAVEWPFGSAATGERSSRQAGQDG